MEDDEGFILLTLDGPIVAAQTSLKFAWSDDTRYWENKENPNGILWDRYMSLIKVGWCTPWSQVRKLAPGTYNVWMRHGLLENHTFIECVNLKIKQRIEEDDEKIPEKTLYHQELFPSAVQGTVLY